MFDYLPSPEKINRAMYARGFTDLTSEKYAKNIFCVVLRDAPMRISPTCLPRRSPEGFDLNCETLCRTCEPLVLLNPSPQNGFYRVLSSCSSGFIHRDSIALISRREALMLLRTDHKLFVTDKFIITNPSENLRISKIPLSFSTRVPLKEKGINYEILLPYKDSDGYCRFESAQLPVCPALHPGPLPFTRKNLLSLGLRMLGMPYDWGESFGGCDCSALVRSAFSLCGVAMPRNTCELFRLPGRNISQGKVSEVLSRCRRGDLILSEGHVMIYYGKKNGIHFVFHSFFGTRGVTDITPITEPTSSGLPLYEGFRKIIPLNFLANSDETLEISVPL